MEINGLREGMPSEREGAGVENEKASIRSCAGSRPWALLYRLLKRPSGRMAEDFLNRSRLIEPVRNQTFAFGKNFVGDYANGNIYELSATAYDDAGDPIIRYRRSPHIYKELRDVFYSMLEVEMETGRGLVSGQGVAPAILM
ncbi:MAG: hypothetical protein KJ649_10555, partial [Proteobacteria bacterium]|nr:hypothetical protein [Pseudomonadota bacterium]